MAKEYLDQTGLTYFWSKIKTILNTKLDIEKVASTGDVNTPVYFDENGEAKPCTELSESSNIEIVRW